uniref:Uncharacterized protein n=1 Tax=Tetradesmus obliquus TaxID=3088 RepID=A0A383V743_TETOB|eukprot:jgi/Sobl393_1/12525/SZX60763.1
MDFYPDVGPAVSAAQLQLQAWHLSSSPSAHLRSEYLPRLSCIPEGPAEERQEAAQPVQQDQQNPPCAADDSSTGMPAGLSSVCDVVLQLLEHPCTLQKQQRQQQLVGGTFKERVAREDAAAAAAVRQMHAASSPFEKGSGACSMRSSSSSSSSSSDSSSEALDLDGEGEPEPAADDDAAGAGDLTAAASTWAMEIRHFTDCLPITPDSVCSSSTYLTLTGAQQPEQKQQQQAEPQLRHSSQEAAAVRSCSLPRSSSSTSLPKRCSSDGDAVAVATEAALQASLAALQELDDLEWCPWDRVAVWLESHAAAAAAGAAGSEQQTLQQPGSGSERALSGSGGSSRLQLASSSSLPAAFAAEASAGEQQQQQQQGAAVEPVFDAPAWWQEAVLQRLEQQRQAFQGSWWSRARVLASLAATRAACALQI